MKERFSRLARARVGFQPRGAVKHNEQGEVAAVQMGNVSEGKITYEQLPRMNLPQADVRDFITDGDILFRSRGTSYTVAVVPPDFLRRVEKLLSVPTYSRLAFSAADAPPLRGVVAVAPLFVIEWHSRRVSTDYLTWFLNREETQKYFAANAHGSYTASVSIQTLNELEVIVPPLEIQKRIVEADALMKDEARITLELLAKKEQWLQATLNDILKKEMR